jgi:hypothetical protein
MQKMRESGISIFGKWSIQEGNGYTFEETKMTHFAPLSIFHNPNQEEKEKLKRLVIGACILCWAAVGLFVIVGSVSIFLGLN